MLPNIVHKTALYIFSCGIRCDTNYTYTYVAIFQNNIVKLFPEALRSPRNSDCYRYSSRLLEILGSFDAGLCHQIANVLFQIVNSGAHLVYARDDLVGHRLELVLHVLQQLLDLFEINVVFVQR